MSHWSAQVDEVANEIATWPGIAIERRDDGAAVIRYEHLELGLLHLERGVAELPEPGAERDELIERGWAEPADGSPHAVAHDVHGPSDIAAVLELFERRYREARGEGEPPSFQDPA